jgi:hypothetical protein
MLKKFNRQLIALAVSLVFSAGTMAQALSKADYHAGKDTISVEHKLADSQVVGAAQDAQATKLNTQYAVENEKCDTYVGPLLVSGCGI